MSQPVRSSPAGARSTARTGGQGFSELCLRRLPPGRILNVGSGYTNLKSATQIVVNVDLDPAVLPTGALCVAADGAMLPFSAGTFNGAILKDILEHVPDPVLTLSELARVTRVGAGIVLTVPRAIPRAVWADPTHLRGFTKRSIRWTLEMGGWEVQGRVDRIGSIPAAGRIPLLLEHAHQILRLPGIGHRLGTNWLVMASRKPR
jgi:SAM-dependent methyltransferase